jgi:hypothetical protein
MDNIALNAYIDMLAVDVAATEEYLMDIVLASYGSLQYADIWHMTSEKIKLFIARILAKNQAESGTSAKEYL